MIGLASTPGVVPHEIWDLPTPEGPLWERLGAGARRARTRPDGDAARSQAEVIVRELVPALRARGAAAIWLTGGLVRWIPLRAALDARGHLPEATSLRIVDDLAHEGAQALGLAGPVLVDLGQTAAKLSGAGPGRLRVARPSWLAPGVPGDGDAAVGWAREVLGQARRRSNRLVLALPVAIGEDLTPGSSSWSGWEGRRSLVDDLTEGLGFAEVRAVNDAVLAAWGAKSLGAPPGTWVVTLGFGPGAAEIVG